MLGQKAVPMSDYFSLFIVSSDLSKLGKWGVIWKLIWCAITYIYAMVTNILTIVL